MCTGMNIVNLLEVFKQDIDGCQSIVLKHFPEDTDERELQEYVEKICKSKVKCVCIPAERCGVAIAIFSDIVYDGRIKKWQERAFSEDFNGSYPTLELLGKPTGVFVNNVPDGVSDELLLLYFEHSGSGGVEGTVDETVEQTVVETRRYAIVQITDERALASILSKQSHTLLQTEVKVGPFYPVVHRPMLETLKSRDTNKEALATIKQTDTATNQNVIQASLHVEQDKDGACLITDSMFHEDEKNCSNIEHLQDSKHETRDVAAKRVGSKQAVDEVKLVVSHESDSFKEQRGDICTKKGMHSQCTGGFEQTIDLPSYKIELLSHFKFKKKYETENLAIALNKNDEKVSFKATSPGDLKAATVQMYECLDKDVAIARKLPDHRFAFLSRKSCLDCLRSKCDEYNLNVVYEIDKNKKEIKSHSFVEEHAKRGIQLLDTEMTTIKVDIRPEQRKCMSKPAWTSLLASLDRDETTVYLTGETLNIESMRDHMATEAKQKILQYLKNTQKPVVSKKEATVTLESSKARCFKTCLEQKLRGEILARNGTIDVVPLSESPLKLRVSVQGGETAADNMKNALQQIWHESIDFNTISSAAEDVWLIMNGLECQKGTDFFSKFEQRHNCFFEVSKHGDFSVPRTRVKVEDIVDSSDDELKASALTDSSGNYTDNPEHDASSNVYKKDGNAYRGRKKKDQFSNYKTEMSEEEELKMALELSMQSSKTDEQILKPAAVVRPHRFSDNEDECTEDSDRSEIKCSVKLPSNLQDDRKTQTPVPYKRNKINQAENKPRSLQISNVNVQLVNGAVAKQQQLLTGFHGNFMETINTKRRCEHHVPSTIKDNIWYVLSLNRPLHHDRRVKISPARGVISFVKDLHKKNLKPSGQKPKGLELGYLADALVNVVSASRGFSEGVLPKSFLELGGEELSQMFEDAKPTASGDVVATDSSGELRCTTVFHVQLQKSKNCQRVIRKAVSDVLHECTTRSFHTVAFPAIGVGRMFRFPPQEVAETMLSEVCDILQKRRNKINQIIFAIYDREVFEIYDAAFEKCKISHCNGQALDPHASVKGKVRPKKQMVSEKHHSPSGADHQEQVFSAHKQSTQRSSSNGPKLGSDKSDCPESGSVPNYRVKVIAENKQTCIKARNAFYQKIKDKFLQEEIVERTQKISQEAKQKITKIITTNHIKAIKSKDKYILRGQRGNVQKAHAEILKVLLAEKDSLAERKERKSHTKRETKEFVEVMVRDEPEVPCYWKNFKKGETLKSLLLSAKHFLTRKPFELVEVNKDSVAFCTIVKMINATFDCKVVGQGQDASGLDAFGYTKLFVLKIERVENLRLYEQFTLKRQELFRCLYASGLGRYPKLEDIPSCTGSVATKRFVNASLDKDVYPEINEHLLFHGTKDSSVEVICKDGLDPRLSSGNAMFGSGIYGAESATKADQYADDKDKRSAGQGNRKKMFLIRMVLGNSYLCTNPNPHKYRRPPCTHCYRDDCKNPKHGRGKFGNAFDSVVGDNKKLFREFVVYDNRLCYPEYLITYERR